MNKAAGFVIFNRNRFLALRKNAEKEFWDFPKGHVESEDDIDAAVRELFEETGITNFQIVPGFREEITYFDGNEEKIAVYFLAFTDEVSVKLSSEHKSYKWMENLEELTFENQKNLIKSAKDFLKSKKPKFLGNVAVVGASRNEEKYGFKIFKYLLNRGARVFLVNPNADSIFYVKCFPKLSAIKERIDIVDIVVPPKIAVSVVREAVGIRPKIVWLQPGSESDEAIELCRKNGIKVIYNACIMEDTRESDNIDAIKLNYNKK